MFAPVASTIDDFSDETSDGVNLNELPPLTTLVVRTRNSLYRIVVWRGTTVLLQGGRRFPRSTRCRLNGSGLGGSVLKLAWIGVGLRMEIAAKGRCIVTSPVREITTECPTSAGVHKMPAHAAAVNASRS